MSAVRARSSATVMIGLLVLLAGGAGHAANADPAAVFEATRARTATDRSALAEREAAHARRLEQARERLQQARQRFAALEADGRALEQRFDDNNQRLAQRTAELRERIGALKELFGVFQQTASDLMAAFAASPTSFEAPDRERWLIAFAERMKQVEEVTTTEDIRRLTAEISREIDMLGRIARLRGPVYEDGQARQREVVRIGGFMLVAADPSPAYLVWDVGQARAELPPRQPPPRWTRQLASWLDAGTAIAALPVDPSRGGLIQLLARQPTLVERIAQGGLVGELILVLGFAAGLALIAKLVDLVVLGARMRRQEQSPEAPRSDNPLGWLLACAAEARQRAGASLPLLLADCVERGTDRIRSLLVVFQAVAAIAPLLGLLGTVVGMINTFQAITLYGTGDPRTMAGGISQALVTTVLGLAVAVPAVIAHAVLDARCRSLAERLERHAAGLLADAARSSQEAGA